MFCFAPGAVAIRKIDYIYNPRCKISSVLGFRDMKKLIFLILFVFVCNCAFGQKKRLQHNVALGGGIEWETAGLKPVGGSLGGSVNLAYGLDIMLGKDWSVMPGLGLSAYISKSSHSGEILPFAELFCLGRYRAQISGHNVVLGLGPEFQLMANDGRYYDYTEGWHGWHFTVPNNWFPFQFSIKAQALMAITDRFSLGLELNCGARQIYVPANLYLNSLRLCAAIRL